MRQPDFDRLFAEQAQPLYRFLVYRTGDATLAEDLVADTFERVLTTKRPFDPRRATQKTWVYAIALNLLRDHARRTAAADRALERIVAGARDPAPDGVQEEVEQRDALQRALASLSPPDREVVALRHAADLTVAEIARLHGEKPATVERRLYRALRKLQAELS